MGLDTKVSRRFLLGGVAAGTAGVVATQIAAASPSAACGPAHDALSTGGARLAWQRDSDGIPMVFVHGSWDDRHSWDRVAPLLGRDVAVIRYDRRGHSASSAPPGQGSLHEHADDLAAVVMEPADGSAHLVGHSYGALVVLLAAARHPTLARSVLVHEPPAYPLLAGDPRGEPLLAGTKRQVTEVAALINAGRPEDAIRLFAEKCAFGPGSWEELFTPEQRATMVANAGTWLDQYHDPDHYTLDLDRLAAFPGALTLTTGTATMPALRMINTVLAGKLPRAVVTYIAGAGHAPQLSHPAEFVAAVRGHLDRAHP
ncbi:alpha/beta fold hydrolase [Streptomyces sp. NPDC052396]|uniref:alpha/beta fold hydrolase n=1 Tax=Streptomyces sp. NPDC052396 TaxID=3365689 RepID=UPI0037D5AE2A